VGGGLIRVLGFRWKSVNQTRQKMVGWVNKHYLHGMNDEAQFTEYDINYDLIPSLDRYKDLAYYAYQEQFGMKKAKKKKEKGNVPFIYPPDDADMTKYRFHCENTPALDFRTQLNTMFFPVHRNNDLSKHPNFMNPHPVMGMYGILVLDCNHGCHPEIHPYEWVWWLNLTEEKTTWNVGFLRDVSNRFKHWSTKRRTGEINVPFTFSLDEENWSIQIDHQMFGNFSEEGFKELDLQGEYYAFDETSRVFELGNDLNGQSITVNSNVKIPYESLQYALRNLKLNKQEKLLTGELHLAMSINEVYTAEIITSSSKIESESSDFGQLLELMQGSFSSKLQAASDTDYYDISLHMYPIWEDLGPGWLYVEQAVSSMPDKPYRQRIYQVQQIDAASFRSDIYTLPNEESAISKWNDPSFFDQWEPADLKMKEGCGVYLKKTGEFQFEGSTLNGTCLSDFRGASYTTSVVNINADGLANWDRGFDANGSHVWGAEKGAYDYKK
jgi:CpeT protein